MKNLLKPANKDQLVKILTCHVVAADAMSDAIRKMIMDDGGANHPSEVVKAGEKIQVTVIEIDEVKRRLKLSMKDAGPNDQDLFIEEYKPGDTVTGRVSRIKKDKAVIDLGEGVEAVCVLTGPKAGSEAATPAASAAKDVSSLGAMLASAWKGADDGPSGAMPRRADRQNARQSVAPRNRRDRGILRPTQRAGRSGCTCEFEKALRPEKLDIVSSSIRAARA